MAGVLIVVTQCYYPFIPPQTQWLNIEVVVVPWGPDGWRPCSSTRFVNRYCSSVGIWSPSVSCPLIPLQTQWFNFVVVVVVVVVPWGRDGWRPCSSTRSVNRCCSSVGIWSPSVSCGCLRDPSSAVRSPASADRCRTAAIGSLRNMTHHQNCCCLVAPRPSTPYLDTGVTSPVVFSFFSRLCFLPFLSLFWCFPLLRFLFGGIFYRMCNCDHSGSRGFSPSSGMKFGRKKLKTLRYHRVTTRSLYLTGASFGSVQGRDGQTDGQTDRIMIASTCAVARKMIAQLLSSAEREPRLR